MSIKEFVRQSQDSLEQNEDYGVQWHSRQYYLKDWNGILESGGYYNVSLTEKSFEYARIASKWCKEQFGSDHYYLTGNTFWFECESHAAIFALRWV